MKKLRLASYNILASLHPTEITRTLKEMAKGGVSCICLQEVVRYLGEEFIGDRLLEALGEHWQKIEHIGAVSGRESVGTMILWNTRELTYKESEKIHVPSVKYLAPHEYLFTLLGSGRQPRIAKRRMLSVLFVYEGKPFRVTDIHLEHTGGAAHRRRQLRNVLKEVHAAGHVSREVYCGDFNTFDLRRSGEEYEGLKRIFGDEVIDVSEDSGTTADLFDVDTSHSIFLFKWIIRGLSIHIRRKLDYIWAKGFTSWSCTKLEVAGSDHKPLVAELSI